MSFGFLVSLLKFVSLEDLATSVATDGVKGLFTFRKRRKEEKRAQDQYESIKRIETLAERFAKDPSQKVRTLADTLSPLIADLHVKSCHESLSKLRQEVPVDDQRSLSRIDFYLGCCSRHVNPEQCEAEYERAYNEMIAARVYDNDIVAAKVFLQCKKKNSQAAIQAAEGLKQHDYNNIWTWVPGLMFADNLTEAYQALPSEVNAKTVLATASMMGTKDESFGVDLQTYRFFLPTSITYENIAEWVFDLSILVTRYINEWNFSAYLDDTQPGPACKEFNAAFAKFNEHLAKTQLGKFVKDVDLWYLMSQYQMTQKAELLDEIKTCPCSDQFKTHRILAYANFLAKVNRFEEAKAYLDEQGLLDDASIINMRLLLALQTADAKYAVTTLKGATEGNVEFSLPQMVYLLHSAKTFPEQVKPFVSKLIFPEGKDFDACRLIVSLFVGEDVDETFLLENRKRFNSNIAPFVALALHAKGHIEEAIALCEQTMSQDVIDLRTFVYIEILEKSPSHADKLYKVLGDLRCAGLTHNLNYLVREYTMAARVKDVDTMYAVAKVLYEKKPDNASYFVCLFSTAANCRDADRVEELTKEVSKYQFEPSEAAQIFNVFVSTAKYEQALEFLYGYIKSHPANEGLNMLFHEAVIHPAMSVIVNREYDSVFDGAYVHFEHNGQQQKSEVTSTTKLNILIGKAKGEVIDGVDRMNRKDKYKILTINNHYCQLIEEIYEGIGEGNYNSAYSFQFTEEEMKSGNILAAFNRMLGRDSDWFQQHNEQLQEYKQGKLPIAVFLNKDNTLTDLYTHLFGSFKVYGIAHQELDKLYELKNENIEVMDFVLDLSSLIMLFELQQRFNLTYDKRFIVPQGIYRMVELTLLKEQNGTPSFISQQTANLLADIHAGESEYWIVARLRSLLAWIDQNAEVEVATEILNVDDQGVFNRSEYFALFYESLTLAHREGRMLMAMDSFMLRMFGGFVPIIDVNAFIHHFCADKYVEACRFFMQASIFGSEIDTKYVVGEYTKFAIGQPSYFKNCQENLMLSAVNYTQVIEVCETISQRAVLLDIDMLTIETLFRDMFKLFDRQYAGLVLRIILTQSHNVVIRSRAQSAFYIVHPLFH